MADPGKGRRSVQPSSEGYREVKNDAVEALVHDLARLDSQTAYAVIEEARELAHEEWLLAQEQAQGTRSGQPELQPGSAKTEPPSGDDLAWLSECLEAARREVQDGDGITVDEHRRRNAERLARVGTA